MSGRCPSSSCTSARSTTTTSWTTPTTRRTVDSVNAKWGNLKAILAGDYLLAQASEIAASLGTEVAGLLAATIGEPVSRARSSSCRARSTSTAPSRPTSPRSTARPPRCWRTACRIGGIVAELPRPQIDALTTFGRSYGMAFQIVDDLLDVTSTDEQLGKPAGHDLVEGTYTLPVIRTLAAGGAPADELRSLLARLRPTDGTLEPVDDPEAISAARVLLRATPAVQTVARHGEGLRRRGPSSPRALCRHRGHHRPRRRLRAPARHRRRRRLTRHLRERLRPVGDLGEEALQQHG